MRSAEKKKEPSFALPEEKRRLIEERWQKAIPFFRKRSPVVFFSYCRFWESHGFVQQSLAKCLTDAGIPVRWIDGAGWRPYRPVLYFQSPLLTVEQLFELPGRRLSAVDSLSIKLGARRLSRVLERQGGRPLFWVQAGIDERLAEAAPYIDVFSVFDDPYRHSPSGPLCQKADLVLCQSTPALRLMAQLSDKARLALPPVEISREVFSGEEKVALPENFPRKVMGYIGSFFPESFDFALFEKFMKAFPDWGFVLLGRTDSQGETIVSRLTRDYSNFARLPWVPRASLGAAWRCLDVSLLLYKPFRSQDGAFATKVLESAFFGVPCVATEVPKTEDIAPWFPRGSDPALAAKATAMGCDAMRAALEHFALEMSPKLHLARVAEFLSGRK